MTTTIVPARNVPAFTVICGNRSVSVRATSLESARLAAARLIGRTPAACTAYPA